MNTSLNHNLPESQFNISDSSTDSGHFTNHSSDSFTLDTKADDSMIDWECCSTDSECDSSCLSFDVDDLSFCVDDKSQDSPHCQMPSQSLETKSYINNVIHYQIGVQLWGDDYTVCSDSTQSDCDVCNLLKMKRQRASTDLRFDGRKQGSSGLFSNSTFNFSVSNSDVVRSMISNMSSLACESRDKITSVKNTEGSKMRKSRAYLSSAHVIVVKQSVSSCSLSPKEKLFRKSLENRGVSERLHSEGTEDNANKVYPTGMTLDHTSSCYNKYLKDCHQKNSMKSLGKCLKYLSNDIQLCE